ncbi:MAG: divergent PAP2 family protein [Salinispira sp.]
MNLVLISATISWLVTQCIKTLIHALFRKTPRGLPDIIAGLLWQTGGMPSSHGALVTALTVSIGILEGTGSSVFVLSLFFGIIVIRDSLGVRLSSGRQAHTLNKLGKNLKKKFAIDFTVVKEVHGHTPLEVLVGMLIGGTIALIVSTLSI